MSYWLRPTNNNRPVRSLTITTFAFTRVAGAIELLFRDVKQFTGLSQRQARSDEKLDYHLNATLSTVNVARLLLTADASLLNSMNALVRRETNRRVWKLIYNQLSLDGSVDVNRLDILNCQNWQFRAA